MVEVIGLWVPPVLVAIVMTILGAFVLISLAAPEPDNKVLIMSVQNPANSGGTYSLNVCTASQHSPLHLVQGQAQPFSLAFQLPSGTPQSLAYDVPSFFLISMTLTPS